MSFRFLAKSTYLFDDEPNLCMMLLVTIDHICKMILDIFPLSWIIPPPEQRRPFTLWTAPLAFAWVVPIILGVHLRLRHPRFSQRWRILYASIAIPLVLRIVFSFYTPIYRQNADGSFLSFHLSDYAMGIYAAWGCSILLEACFESDERMFDVEGADEYRAWVAKESVQSTKRNLLASDDIVRRPKLFPGTWMPLSIDIVTSARGLGYGRGVAQMDVRFKAGYSAYIDAMKQSLQPKDILKQAKWTKVKRVAWTTFKAWLLCDFLDTLTHHPAIIPSPNREHPPIMLSNASFGVFGRAGPLIATALYGGALIAAPMHLQTCIIYLISLLFTDPVYVPVTVSRNEPPAFRSPHLATSLRSFWGKRWHHSYRRMQVFLGYYPAKKVSLRVGIPYKVSVAFGVLATFLVSGLSHELCHEMTLPHFQHWDMVDTASGENLRSAERGFGAHRFAATRFFLSQGVGLVMEDFWSGSIEPLLCRILLQRNDGGKILKGRLRGILGWLWCMGWLIYFCQDWMDTTLQHGFDASSHGGPHLFRPIIDVLVRTLSG